MTKMKLTEGFSGYKAICI